MRYKNKKHSKTNLLMREMHHTYGLPLNALYALSGDKALAFSDKIILKLNGNVNETETIKRRRNMFLMEEEVDSQTKYL